MRPDLADRPPEITLTLAAVPAPLLDHALAWQLDWASRTGAEPAHGRPRIEFVVEAGERDPDAFWRAANARAAELCWTHRVEILLVQEGSELRIVVERHEPAGPAVTVADDDRAPASPRPRGPLARLRAVLARRAARSSRLDGGSSAETGAMR